jgi:hypothetical protein
MSCENCSCGSTALRVLTSVTEVLDFEQPGPTWGPRDTAPKDGSQFLCVSRSGWMEAIRYNEPRRHFCLSDGREVAFSFWTPLPGSPFKEKE